MSDSTFPFLGIDIGGTKISVCLGTSEGKILDRERFPTNPAHGPDPACDKIANVASLLLERNPDCQKIAGVGVSAPGPLSSRAGHFINPPNMPTWHGFSIVQALESRLGHPVRLMNDANASALAEWRFGAGKGAETLVFFTMSTGMGAGLIIGGRLHEGPDDMAGEVGHLPVSPDGPVGFSRRGSLEGFCSGPGLAQLAVLKLTQAIHTEEDSKLFHLGKDYRLVNAEDVGAAAVNGDRIARDVFREVGEKLGMFSSWIVDVLNPDIIVVGTIGRIHADLILPPAREEINRACHPASASRVRLVPAKLEAETGDLAAICAALEPSEKQQ